MCACVRVLCASACLCMCLCALYRKRTLLHLSTHSTSAHRRIDLIKIGAHFKNSADKCCVCGGGNRRPASAPMHFVLLSSSLTVNGALSWPSPVLHGPPSSSSKSWLGLSEFPILPRCTAERNPSCPWDACDAGMQRVLEASCEGPYGSAEQVSEGAERNAVW